MDKDTLEQKQAKVKGHWGQTRDLAMVTAGQTGYMTRLTALRDSMVKQEQLYLARAVERLRAHSLSNKAASRRLRMTRDDVNKSPAKSPKNNLMTTAEKFRQMRPKEQRPVIFPLLGTHIFGGSSTKLASSSECLDPTGKSNKYLRESCDVRGTMGLSGSQVDDMVQMNLRRLRGTPRSIPNIGRKAMMDQECPEPKIKSLLNMRPRLHRQNGGHFSSLFLPFNSSTSQSSSHASPDTTHLNHEGLDDPPSRILHPASCEQEVNSTNGSNDTEKSARNNPKYFANCVRQECQCRELKDDCLHNESSGKLGCVVLEQPSNKIWHPRRQTTTPYGQTSSRKLKQLEAVVISGKIIYGYKKSCLITEINNDSCNIDNENIEYNNGNDKLNNYQLPKASGRKGKCPSPGNMDEYNSTTFGSKKTPPAVITRSVSSVHSLNKSRQRHKRDLPNTSNSGGDLSIEIVPLILQNTTELYTKKHENHTEVDSSGDVQGNRAHRKHIIVNIPREDTQENRKHIEEILIDIPQIDRRETQKKHFTKDMLGRDIQGTKMREKHILVGMSQAHTTENRTNKNHIVVNVPHIDTQEITIHKNHIEVDEPHIDTQEITTQKNHIVVDMPSIIFNAPSPVPQHLSVDESRTNEIENQNTYFESPLRKAVLRQEMRMRELANLMEDVKDLSSKTETLKLKPATEVILQQNIF